MKLDAKIPPGKLADKWSFHRSNIKLVAPNNKPKYHIIVVGAGLAGASAAATLAGLGYKVSCFFFHDSARRAHSIAAQGGINAAKNYQNDGDSVWRLFYDTLKGGEFRAREANVYRLAELSGNIIDQAVAQGVPFAREYGGLLDNRSFGGAQVSRTFYARGQTGQQLLLGAYQQMSRCVRNGGVKEYPRTEMLDVVVIDGRARGIVVRDMITGKMSSHVGDAVVLATGGYSNVFFLSTNAKTCNVTATWRAFKRGAGFANPCFTQIHPTCIPQSGDYQSKLTLMSESLRNDGRCWAPKKPGETTTWSGSTRATATWRRATLPLARRRNSATRAAASAPVDEASISISVRRSVNLAKIAFANATAISSRCMRRSPAKIRTSGRCASIPRLTTRWAGPGSITT
jgi:succinate dehydrogenase / fumarate reductase flavoprotein subunit